MHCVSIEHKLGIKATPTAVLQFGDHGGAVGYLVGQENRGLEYMFIMMNAARYAVGVQGIAIAERAYQQAVAYAKDRVQSRPVDGSMNASAPIIHHPDVKRMLMTMRAYTEGCRAMATVAAAAYDAAHHHPDAEVRKQNQAFYEFMVPLVKGYSTEMSLEVTSLGVQVHGGMGFIEETGAAQYYRDARILTIYEGTTAIQANDLVGRKTARDGGQTAKAIAAQIAKTEAELAQARQRGGTRRCSSACRRRARPSSTWSTSWPATPRRRPTRCSPARVPYLMLAGNLMAGWQLARSLLVAEDLSAKGEDTAFMQAKIATARFYADHILSQGARACATPSSKARTASRRWRSKRSEGVRRVDRRGGPAVSRIEFHLSGNPMSKLPTALQNLALPVIGSPLFIISNPKLVIEQCKAGIVGSMPALNARPAAQLDEWLHEITETLAAYDQAHPEAPGGAVRHQPDRAQEQRPAASTTWRWCVKYKVPIIITSLGARTDVNEAIHSYGGIVLHDIINNTFAHKAIEKGADGLIAVAAGAGGHAGVKSPFALIQEIRQWFDGPLALSAAPSPPAAPCWPRRPWARTSPTSARPSSPRTRRAPRRLQAGDRRLQFRRHRVLQPVHRRARQLPEAVDPRRRPGPGQPARRRREDDELLRRRGQQVQGLEGHLGLRPGHRRRDRGRRAPPRWWRA